MEYLRTNFLLQTDENFQNYMEPQDIKVTEQQYNQHQEMCYFPMLYEYAQESHGREWDWGEWNEWDQAVKEEAEDTSNMRHEEGKFQ